MSYLFETHPLVLSYMVPSLLSVYSDVEHTDRANQFYAKFNMRQYIGERARMKPSESSMCRLDAPQHAVVCSWVCAVV
jgi:hypothetical protein